MLRITHILLICLSAAFGCKAQKWNLSSTAVEVGDVFISQNGPFFGLGKWNLVSESIPFLDSLERFLQNNPTVSIEISHHCDSRASNSYSLDLTQLKANTIVDSLIARGVAAERLKAKGCGESQPIIPDAEISILKTEQERENAYAVNRRTESKIIAIDFQEK
ncbi:MAG: OmpA family protein [Flavobacteriales bacterium]|nr:OmpA family protein [Flavobacteriales bacterium]